MTPDLLETGGWLLLASLALLAAHTVRAMRWALLFSPADLTRRFNLLLALALGYAVNTVVPWRLGELLRAWFTARRESVRLSYVAATVVGERLSDLVAVAMMATVLLPVWAPAPPVQRLRLVLGPLVLATLVLLFCLALQRSPALRRRVWAVASVFNDRIRFTLVDFVWSLGELVAGGQLWRPRFLVATVSMWALYLGAYALFARAVGAAFGETTLSMLGAPLKPLLAQSDEVPGRHAVAMLVFTMLPVAGVIGYGAVKQWPVIRRMVTTRRRYGWYERQAVSGGARNRFKAESEYQYFLASLFSGDNKVASQFGLEALEDATVHRLFAGGSDAITALVETGDTLVIRKFATGAAASKLHQQEQWLARHRAPGFSLVQVLAGVAKPTVCYYDMPLVVPANDFYDFIHSNPVESSRTILREVFEQVSSLHAQQRSSAASPALVGRYLEEKASANARAILAFARTVLPGERFSINGEHHDLAQWQCLLDPQWLAAQVRRDDVTVVHGDLTIENIIVAPQVGPGWYLIDPNPENVFNSPLIDWGKLLQSLHLGYEGLNRNYSCTLDGSEIRLAFTRSQAYTELHRSLDAWLTERLGEDGLREAYFHELVNYLRLVPYKVRQNPKKGIVFFACTSVLLKAYRERWA